MYTLGLKRVLSAAQTLFALHLKQRTLKKSWRMLIYLSQLLWTSSSVLKYFRVEVFWRKIDTFLTKKNTSRGNRLKRFSTNNHKRPRGFYSVVDAVNSSSWVYSLSRNCYIKNICIILWFPTVLNLLVDPIRAAHGPSTGSDKQRSHQLFNKHRDLFLWKWVFPWTPPRPYPGLFKWGNMGKVSNHHMSIVFTVQSEERVLCTSKTLIWEAVQWGWGGVEEGGYGGDRK